jgi:hypothetical protein
MNCPECHELLQQRLDGRSVADRTLLDQHLTECDDCRQRHAALLRLIEGLRLLPRPQASAGLASRIALQALAQGHADFRFRRRLWTAAAIAASLLLMTLAAYQGHRSGWFGPTHDEDSGLASKEKTTNPKKDLSRPKKDTPVPKKDAATPKKDRVAVVQAAPPLDQTLKETGKLAFDWTRRAAGETMANAQRWLPPAPSLALASSSEDKSNKLSPMLEPLAKPFREVGERVSAGLEPVASSAPRALHSCTQFIDMFLQEGQPAKTGS